MTNNDFLHWVLQNVKKAEPIRTYQETLQDCMILVDPWWVHDVFFVGSDWLLVGSGQFWSFHVVSITIYFKLNSKYLPTYGAALIPAN